MTWEDVVEHLAFGRHAPKPGPCLGMYLSPETIYIAQTHLDEAGKLVVEQLVRIPVPAGKAAGPSAATLNTSFLAENARLETLIRDSMSHIAWNSKRVMVTLSHHLGLLRYFTMPAVDRRYWKSAIPLEAKKHIPIPFDVLNYDYLCVPLPPDDKNRPHRGALIAVTQKQNPANITAMLGNLGLALAGIEVAPCSVIRLERTLSLSGSPAGRPFCQVHFEQGMAHILIADKGLPVFFREVFLGEESGAVDQRKVDLGGCLSFVQKSLMVGTVPAVVVSGTCAQMDAWKEVFTQETGLPVHVRETAVLLGIKDADWGGFSAIGASLRFQLPSEANLDLGAVDRISEEEKAVAMDILVAAGVLTIFFFICGLFKTAVYHFQARAFNSIRHNAEIEAILRNKSPAMVEEMFEKMRNQAALTQDICGKRRASLVSFIKDVVDSLPKKVWLTNLSINRPLQKTAAAGTASLKLSGHATAQDIAHEQDLAFQFRDQLAKSPILGLTFTDLKMTISHEQASYNALNPNDFAEQQEKRTQFAMDGAKARQER